MQAQSLGFHPLLNELDYDLDDDGIIDALEAAEGTASLPLAPYTSRVLKLSGGSAYLELPNQPRFALSESWSLDAWVKIDSKANGEMSIIKREIDTDLDGVYDRLNYELGLKRQGASWLAFVRYSGKSGVMVEKVSEQTLLVDTWTHVGAVYDQENNYLALFLDNGARVSLNTVGAVNPGTMIGQSRVRVGEKFHGRLDSVRIWNIAKPDFGDYLDATRNRDYHVPRIASGMVAHYIFDDGGQSLQDFAMEVDNWNHGWLYAAVLQGQDANNLVIEDSGAPVIIVDDVMDYVDSDGDGLDDAWERLFFGDLTTAGRESGPGRATTPQGGFVEGWTDSDGDGLNDFYEFLTWNTRFPTDPTKKSTYPELGTDAELDSDGDGLSNLYEQLLGSHPGLVDTDDDGFDDGYEAGIRPDAEGNYFDGFTSPAQSLEQPNAYGTAPATSLEYAKVFRMLGSNNMTVEDNGDHSGDSMSLAFWFRPSVNSSFTVYDESSGASWAGRYTLSGGTGLLRTWSDKLNRWWMTVIWPMWSASRCHTIFSDFLGACNDTSDRDQDH